MPNTNPYPNLNLNLILTLKPSLNTQKGFKGLSEWGPAKMSSLSKKCPHFHGVKLKWLKIGSHKDSCTRAHTHTHTHTHILINTYTASCHMLLVEAAWVRASGFWMRAFCTRNIAQWGYISRYLPSRDSQMSLGKLSTSLSLSLSHTHTHMQEHKPLNNVHALYHRISTCI